MLIIKNGFMIDPASGRNGCYDIAVKDGRFCCIEKPGCLPPDLSSAESGKEAKVIDASGLCIAPGLIDTHSHFRDPGQTNKEDIHTGAAAAVRGGYTSVIMMANTVPPVDSPEVLKDVLERGKDTPVHLYGCANVTRQMRGMELTDMAALKEAGAVGFTDDGVPVMNKELLTSALKKASGLGLPVSLHEEDPAYIIEAGINAGRAAAAMGLSGADRMAEITLIRRDTEIAARLGAKLCIQHISTAEGVDIIRRIRKDHPYIHAEATPQHMNLTEDAVLSKGTLAKVNPPLRTQADREAIIEGLLDGTIDIIATDHAPHAADEKNRPFTKAPSGMIGLETSFSLGLKALVKSGLMSLSDYIRLLTVNPADLYGLPAGRITEGAAADLILFDPDEKWRVGKDFASRSSNSPFIGETLPGVIRITITDGVPVYIKD